MSFINNLLTWSLCQSQFFFFLIPFFSCCKITEFELYKIVPLESVVQWKIPWRNKGLSLLKPDFGGLSLDYRLESRLSLKSALHSYLLTIRVNGIWNFQFGFLCKNPFKGTCGSSMTDVSPINKINLIVNDIQIIIFYNGAKILANALNVWIFVFLRQVIITE